MIEDVATIYTAKYKDEHWIPIYGGGNASLSLLNGKVLELKIKNNNKRPHKKTPKIKPTKKTKTKTKTQNPTQPNQKTNKQKKPAKIQ